MLINIVALFLFSTGTLKGYHPQFCGLCSSITGKNYSTCFLNFSPKQKKFLLDEFTLNLVDDCSDCHSLWVLHNFYLCFDHVFFITCLVIPSTCINILSLYYNAPNYQIILPGGFSFVVLMFRMYNSDIETLT